MFPGLSLFLGCHCQPAESARAFCPSAPFPAYRTVIQSQVQVFPPERCLPFLSSCLWKGLGPLGLHGLCDGSRPPNYSLSGLLKLLTLECEVLALLFLYIQAAALLPSPGKVRAATKGNQDSNLWLRSALLHPFAVGSWQGEGGENAWGGPSCVHRPLLYFLSSEVYSCS